MFNKQQQFEFPGSAARAVDIGLLHCVMKWNEMRWNLSWGISAGICHSCWGWGRRALTHDAEQLSYQEHVTDITQCSSKNKNRVLENDVADLFVKQPAVQIRVKGSVTEVKQFWKDRVDVR